MSIVTALAISIGVLGGVATWLFVGFGQGLQIWAAFVAWASFFHCGGGQNGLKGTIASNLLGVVVGWIALVLISGTSVAGSLGLPVWAGIVVGIGAAAMVLAANIPLFAAIPATVYGFACVAGYSLMGGKLGTENLFSASLENNGLINIALSMVIGAVFGFVSEKAGGAMAKSE